MNRFVICSFNVRVLGSRFVIRVFVCSITVLKQIHARISWLRFFSGVSRVFGCVSSAVFVARCHGWRCFYNTNTAGGVLFVCLPGGVPRWRCFGGSIKTKSTVATRTVFLCPEEEGTVRGAPHHGAVSDDITNYATTHK